MRNMLDHGWYLHINSSSSRSRVPIDPGAIPDHAYLPLWWTAIPVFRQNREQWGRQRRQASSQAEANRSVSKRIEAYRSSMSRTALVAPLRSASLHSTLHYNSPTLLPSSLEVYHLHEMAMSLTHPFDDCKADRNLWFYEKIEKNRARFESGEFTKLVLLKQKFRPWAQVLQEDAAVLQQRSSGRRSIRNRVRAFARTVDTKLGSEILLLCTLATSIDKTVKVQTAYLLKDLEDWWRICIHPPLLREAAEMLCKAYPGAKLSGILGETQPPRSSPFTISTDSLGEDL